MDIAWWCFHKWVYRVVRARLRCVECTWARTQSSHPFEREHHRHTLWGSKSGWWWSQEIHVAEVAEALAAVWTSLCPFHSTQHTDAIAHSCVHFWIYKYKLVYVEFVVRWHPTTQRCVNGVLPTVQKMLAYTIGVRKTRISILFGRDVAKIKQHTPS